MATSSLGKPETFLGGARLRLVSLWISHVTRVWADTCLRMYVVMEVARWEWTQVEVCRHVFLFVLLPIVLLGPLIGPLSNSLPKRWVLTGSAVFCLAMILLWGWLNEGQESYWRWWVFVGLSACGSALFSAARFALYPAAAQDAQIPLSRINGLMEMGGAAGVVGGLLCGFQYYTHPDFGFGQEIVLMGMRLPLILVIALGLNVVGFLAVLPVQFPSDINRPEGRTQSVNGFFRDAGRIWRNPGARNSLLALVGFFALVTMGSGLLLNSVGGWRWWYLTNNGFPTPGLIGGYIYRNWPHNINLALFLIEAGVAVGSYLAGLQGHLQRGLGLIPLGLTSFLAWVLIWPHFLGTCVGLGILWALVTVSLRTFYQTMVPVDARGNAMAIMNTLCYGATLVFAWLMFYLAQNEPIPLDGQWGVLLLLSVLGAGIAWWFLIRRCVEMLLELLAWPMYAIRGYGPGLVKFPQEGPVLVVANHSSWFDPAWLSKVVPRLQIPMMTSVFYDLPIMHWLMVNIFHAIRVEASTYRREAPELQEAIAALDRGECVLIFPEGSMRKKADRLLRQFGQGVWHILQERPNTPVVVCWIEGGWGSYASYFGGPPTVNKHLDLRRQIDVAVSEPRHMDPAILADLRMTRLYLMQACLETRRLLGLEMGPEQGPTMEELALAGQEGEESPAKLEA